MPNRIRLTALFANGFLCVAFGVMALATLGTDQLGMVAFFLLIAASSGFSWYVIRKAARVLSEEAGRRADLEQHLAALQAAGPALSSPPLQGPNP